MPAATSLRMMGRMKMKAHHLKWDAIEKKAKQQEELKQQRDLFEGCTDITQKIRAKAAQKVKLFDNIKASVNKRHSVILQEDVIKPAIDRALF